MNTKKSNKITAKQEAKTPAAVLHFKLEIMDDENTYSISFDAKLMEEEEEKMIQDPVAELKNSLHQILKYSGIKESEKKNITTYIETFVNAKDRLATTDDIRRLKKQITEHFFVLYEAVVFKCKGWQYTMCT